MIDLYELLSGYLVGSQKSYYFSNYYYKDSSLLQTPGEEIVRPTRHTQSFLEKGASIKLKILIILSEDLLSTRHQDLFSLDLLLNPFNHFSHPNMFEARNSNLYFDP
jgi:hypothetical protein